jgi:hypothetical protein
MTFLGGGRTESEAPAVFNVREQIGVGVILGCGDN